MYLRRSFNDTDATSLNKLQFWWKFGAASKDCCLTRGEFEARRSLTFSRKLLGGGFFSALCARVHIWISVIDPDAWLGCNKSKKKHECHATFLVYAVHFHPMMRRRFACLTGRCRDAFVASVIQSEMFCSCDWENPSHLWSYFSALTRAITPGRENNRNLLSRSPEQRWDVKVLIWPPKPHISPS